MRPLMVFIMAVVIFGGVRAFLQSTVAPMAPPPTPVSTAASGRYDLELTLTFAAGPDAFSVEDVQDAPSIVVQLNGRELLRRTDVVSAAESPLRLTDIPGVVQGRNEFYLQASPTDAAVHPAVRLRIFQDDVVEADATIWPALADVVQGTVVLEVTR